MSEVKIKVPAEARKRLGDLGVSLAFEALEVLYWPELGELSEMSKRSLAANALVSAAANIAAEGARKENRRPLISRFLGMCRDHFTGARDGPWETIREPMKFIVTINDNEWRQVE